MLLLKRQYLQPDQLGQAQFQDRLSLVFREAQRSRLLFGSFCFEMYALGDSLDQAVFCHLQGFAAADDLDNQVYDIYGEVIPNLYAAGEITGVVHGTNRLGSNADADACTFGFISGYVTATGEYPDFMFETPLD